MNTMDHTAAGTYVDISQKDLEDWLTSIGPWSKEPGKAGIYRIHLSERVGVKVSSTLASGGGTMGHGMASMQLSLVSLVTGNVLNKKAQTRSHFKRTVNWRKTWKDGYQEMKSAYLGNSDFYEAIAVIQDREVYKRDLLARIDLIPDWKNNRNLARIYERVRSNGVLMSMDMETISQAEIDAEEASKAPAAPEIPVARPQEDKRIPVLRALWKAADGRDEWMASFIVSIANQVKAGRDLTEKQVRIVTQGMDRYNILTRDGAPASSLF